MVADSNAAVWGWGVPGVDEGLFLEKAEAAKRDCAVSKALAGAEEINLEAKLVEHAG
jgi:hypothetical protein